MAVFQFQYFLLGLQFLCHGRAGSEFRGYWRLGGILEEARLLAQARVLAQVRALAEVRVLGGQGAGGGQGTPTA